MSSKGYADFFPAAPKVLQRKRSRPGESRHRPGSGNNSPLSYSAAASIPQARSQVERDRPRKPGVTSDLYTTSPLPVPEEGDCTQGDLLNGVGSASSTSTASSIFSTGHRLQSFANHHGSHRSSSVTPLTHVDASPSRETMDSPGRKYSDTERESAAHHHAASSQRREKSLQSPNLDNRQPASPPQARPGKGECKGEKLRYDPDLHKRLSSKEKRSKKPEYVAFGAKVCWLHMHQSPA